jgi:hypothetical protein
MTSVFHTRGFSDTAEFVDNTSAEGRWRLREVHAFGLQSSLRDELATVWNECREADWDGYGARPVTQDALRNTYQLLESLIADIPAPSIGAEPDGDFTLEWHHSPRQTLSVSVSAEGDLHYSALFGSNRVYGTEAFFGDIPQIILDLIRRVHAI